MCIRDSDIAERWGGEIVNIDAMQQYRGMDVGTAKLPPAERRGIAHHLLDTREVRDAATVAEFQGWARATIAELRARAQQGDVGAQAEITALVADLPSSQGCAPEVVETEPEPTMPIPLENPGNPNQG